MNARCAAAHHRMPAAHDHELAPGEALELAAHLSGCASCRTAADGHRAVAARLSRLSEAEPPQGFAARVMERVRLSGLTTARGLMAFALAALAAAALLLRPGAAVLIATWRAAGPGSIGRVAADAALDAGRALVFVFSEAPLRLLGLGNGPGWRVPHEGVLLIGLGCSLLLLLAGASVVALAPPLRPRGTAHPHGEN